jgi:ATP-dependent RNA helicase DDX51/DBP6
VNADAELSTEAATLKREKKSKKSSKATEAGADPVVSQEDVVMEDAPTLETSKKPKKRKSEVVAEREGQEDDVSKKHRAVFSKFEKASKLAEARKDYEEAADEAQEPQGELHGELPKFLSVFFSNLHSIANHM